MLNSVSLTGRLTKGIELRETSGGKAFARFILAVNRIGGEADFISVKVWGKVAENCAKFIGKGSLVAVSGRIETGSYEKDGQTIYTTDVVAHNVHFLDSKKDKVDDPFGEKIELNDDDLPF